MIEIRYYATLKDMSSWTEEYDYELEDDSLAKYMNIGDVIFGNDNEQYNYIVKEKNYDPSDNTIRFRVCRGK